MRARRRRVRVAVPVRRLEPRGERRALLLAHRDRAPAAQRRAEPTRRAPGEGGAQRAARQLLLCRRLQLGQLRLQPAKNRVEPEPHVVEARGALRREAAVRARDAQRRGLGRARRHALRVGLEQLLREKAQLHLHCARLRAAIRRRTERR